VAHPGLLGAVIADAEGEGEFSLGDASVQMLSTAKGRGFRQRSASSGTLEARRVKSEAELAMRREKLESVRNLDQANLALKADHRMQLREERFQRMFEEVTSYRGPRAKAASTILEYEASKEKKRREMYNEWDEKIFEPMAKQAYDFVNWNRGYQQKMLGKKNIGFIMPGEKKKMYYCVAKDPTKEQLVQKACENIWAAEAEESATGIKRSCSMPALGGVGGVGPLGGGLGTCLKGCPAGVAGTDYAGLGMLFPLSRSRPVLEPSEWTPVKLEGTSCCGRLSRAAEAGPSATRMRRGGYNAFMPDEMDLVLTAGKRIHRISGKTKSHNWEGTLKGDLCERGEAAQTNYEGCVAPVQDHYTFAQGTEATDQEFPLGKRMFPEFHGGVYG
jgi:hypothetical protein